MKTKLLLLVLAAVAGLIAFAVHASMRIDEANAAMAALAPPRAALRAGIAGLEQRLQAARENLARAAQKAAVTPGERTAPATTARSEASAKPKATTGRLSPETIIANDPQRMAEYSRHYRDTLDLTLGGLFKALRFTSEQIEKFKDLRVAQEQRRMDLRAAMETQGVDLYGSAYNKLTTQLFKDSRKQEAELLGSGQLAEQYLDYRAMWYLRETTQRLASIEVYPDAPATADQVERVTEILARNNERRAPKSPDKFNWQVYGWSWQDWTAINWDAATLQLQGVLAPSQLATLRQFLRPMEAHTAVAKRNSELMTEAGKISGRPGS